MSDYIDGELSPGSGADWRRTRVSAQSAVRSGDRLTVLVWELRELGRDRARRPSVTAGVIERLGTEPIPPDAGGPPPHLQWTQPKRRL